MSPSPEELELIKFVLNIPPDRNPYLAVARKIKDTINLPPLPEWETIIQRSTVFLYVLMLLQAVYLAYARIRVGAFKFWTFSSLGLLRPDVSSMTSLIYAHYATLTIVDLVLEELMKARLHDYSGEILLFGLKFLLIENASWAFLWSCACQCASLMYESPMGAQASVGRAMNPIVRRAMNCFFILVIVFKSMFVIYYYSRAEAAYERARSIVYGVVEILQAEAPRLNPQSYSPLELLDLLTPLRGAQPLFVQVARFIKHGITVYLSSVSFFVVAYVPCLVFSLRSLYARSISPPKLDISASGHQTETYERLARASRKLRMQRRRTVWHAIAAFTTTSVHIPLMVAQVSFKGDGFLTDKRWIIITRVGLHFPFGFLGNGIIGILAMNARQQLLDQRGSPSRKNFNLSSSGVDDQSLTSLAAPPGSFMEKSKIEVGLDQVEMADRSKKSRKLEESEILADVMDTKNSNSSLFDVKNKAPSKGVSFGILKAHLTPEQGRAKRKPHTQFTVSTPTHQHQPDHSSDESECVR